MLDPIKVIAEILPEAECTIKKSKVKGPSVETLKPEVFEEGVPPPITPLLLPGTRRQHSSPREHVWETKPAQLPEETVNCPKEGALWADTLTKQSH